MKKGNKRKVIALILTMTMLLGSVQTTFANTGKSKSETEFMTNYFQAVQSDDEVEKDELRAIEASLERKSGYSSNKTFDEAMSSLTVNAENPIAGEKSVFFDGKSETEINENKEKGIVKIAIDAKAQLTTTTPVDVMFVTDHSGTMNTNITSSAPKSYMVDTTPSMNPDLLYRTVYEVTGSDGEVSYIAYYFNPHEFRDGSGNKVGINSWHKGMIKATDNNFKSYVENELNDEELKNTITTGSYNNLGDDKGYPYQMEHFRFNKGVDNSTAERIFEIKDKKTVNLKDYEKFTNKRTNAEKNSYKRIPEPTEMHTTAATVSGNYYTSHSALSSNMSVPYNFNASTNLSYDRLFMTKSITMKLADTLIDQGIGNRVGTVNFAGDVKYFEGLEKYEKGAELPAAFYDTSGYRHTNWQGGLEKARDELKEENGGAQPNIDRKQYVIFISDGKPTVGTAASAATVVDELQTVYGAEVIAIGINLTSADSTSMNALGADFYENVDSAKRMEEVFKDITETRIYTPASPTIIDKVGNAYSLKLNEKYPLKLEWEENGENKSVEITKVKQLKNYGVTLSDDKKTITWDSSKVNGEETDTVVNGARMSFYQDFNEKKVSKKHFTNSNKVSKFKTNLGYAVLGCDFDNDGTLDATTELDNPGSIVIKGLSTITLEKNSVPGNDTEVEIADAITYNLELVNTGNVDVKGLEIKDFIPEGTGYLLNGSYNEADNSVGFEEIDVEKNARSEMQSFTVNVTAVEEGAIIENVATFAKSGDNYFLNGKGKLALKSGTENNSFDEKGNPALESNKVTHTLVSEELIVPPTPDPTPGPGPIPTPDPGPTPEPIPTPAAPPAAVALVIPPGVAEVLAIADGATTIEDTEVPLAQGGAAWSLLDLILTVVTGLLAVSLLITYFTGRKEEEEEEYGEIKRKGLLRILSAVPMIGAIILFILTQDMTLPMIIVDEWTIVFAAITLVQGAITFFSRKKVEEDDDQAMV